MSKYRIEFQGLSEGLHDFDFDVDNRFFDDLDYSEIKEGSLKAYITLSKKPQLLELDFNIQGFVVVLCDRCLENVEMPIDFQGQMFVKFSDNEEDLTGEIIYLSTADHEVDVAHYIYESIRLSLPLKCVHPDDENGNSTCDPEMLRKIENHEPDTSSEDNIDPRWSDLLKLKENKYN
ncbi:MAG: DUF177 domain-containing protein [Bacteroidales bacterium]